MKAGEKMKKVIIYGMTILISASIPIYFLLIWEPLKAKDVIGNNISYSNLNEENEKELKIDENISINNIEIYNDNIFNNFNNITSEKREKLNGLIRNLAIEDIIKINNYFKDLKNKENISKGMELVKKRMTQDKFEEFKGIIKEYINLEEDI
jgi:glycyl-tRNA synthetase alpha subunit